MHVSRQVLQSAHFKSLLSTTAAADAAPLRALPSVPCTTLKRCAFAIVLWGGVRLLLQAATLMQSTQHFKSD
jgi:hypothetical protein